LVDKCFDLLFGISALAPRQRHDEQLDGNERQSNPLPLH
jgi:hypothetical protein